MNWLSRCILGASIIVIGCGFISIGNGMKYMKSSIDGLATKMIGMEDTIKVQEAEIAELKHAYCILETRVANVTAYTGMAAHIDSDPEVTASLQSLKPGTIAVSRDLFNKGWVFGMKVYINGLGIYEIKDLMADGINNSIDLYMPVSSKKAKRFGKKSLTVALLNI